MGTNHTQTPAGSRPVAAGGALPSEGNRGGVLLGDAQLALDMNLGCPGGVQVALVMTVQPEERARPEVGPNGHFLLLPPCRAAVAALDAGAVHTAGGDNLLPPSEGPSVQSRRQMRPINKRKVLPICCMHGDITGKNSKDLKT